MPRRAATGSPPSADRIFAEPTTITGSIGVFGIQFDLQKLANDHGFTFDSVKTGKFADAITIARPKTDEELAVFQRMVDWIYSQFIAKVAEGRKLKPSFVEEIAQGRVWSGTEAKKLGLVDELGRPQRRDQVRGRAGEPAAEHSGWSSTRGPRTSRRRWPRCSEGTRRRPCTCSRRGSSARLSTQLEARFRRLRALNDPQGRLREDADGHRHPLTAARAP